MSKRYGVGVGVMVGVGVSVGVRLGVGVSVEVGVNVTVGVTVGVAVGVIVTQVAILTLPTQPERIQSCVLQVLPIARQITIQSVLPQTNEESVGSGTGVAVGAGRLTTIEVVGRTTGTVGPGDTGGVDGTDPLGITPVGTSEPLGVATVPPLPFALVVNVHGTPPLSYF